MLPAGDMEVGGRDKPRTRVVESDGWMVGWMDGARLEGMCGGNLRWQRGSRAARRSTRDSVSLQIVTRENGWEVKGNRESNEEGGIVGGD